MKKIIIIFVLCLTFSLRAETFAEFLKKFIPGNVITTQYKDGLRIKIGKIDGENISDIKIYKYDEKNKLKQEYFAKNAQIIDKGKGVANFILKEALLKHHQKDGIHKSHVEKMIIAVTYQQMIRIKGKDYKYKIKE